MTTMDNRNHGRSSSDTPGVYAPDSGSFIPPTPRATYSLPLGYSPIYGEARYANTSYGSQYLDVSVPSSSSSFPEPRASTQEGNTTAHYYAPSIHGANSIVQLDGRHLVGAECHADPRYYEHQIMYPESRHEMPMVSHGAVPSAVWGTGPILDDLPEYQGVHIHAQFVGREGPDWSNTASLLPIIPSESDVTTPSSQGHAMPYWDNGSPVQQLSRSVLEPAPPAVYPLCRWAGCNTWLDDTSPAGVKRHLKNGHHLSRADCLRGVRGACQWEIEGGVCGRIMDLSSYGKHIASVHLKSTAKLCEDCGSVIGRADSLTRHKRDHCTVRRDCQYEYP